MLKIGDKVDHIYNPKLKKGTIINIDSAGFIFVKWPGFDNKNIHFDDVLILIKPNHPQTTLFK